MAIICPRGGTAPRTQQERAELAADLDRAAGHLWQRGNYRAAAGLISQARALDPARADLWAKREAAITQAASGGQPGRPREAEAEAEDGPPVRAPRSALEQQPSPPRPYRTPGQAASAPREPRPGGCPDCGTAQLTYGRERCQACRLVHILHEREADCEAGQ